MTKREASLILGVSQTANKARVKDAHRKVKRRSFSLALLKSQFNQPLG